MCKKWSERDEIFKNVVSRGVCFVCLFVAFVSCLLVVVVCYCCCCCCLGVLLVVCFCLFAVCFCFALCFSFYTS